VEGRALGVEMGAEGSGEGEGRDDERVEAGEARREEGLEQALVGRASDEEARGAEEGRAEDAGRFEAVREAVAAGFGSGEVVAEARRGRGEGDGLTLGKPELVVCSTSEAIRLLFLTRSNLSFPLCTVSAPSAPPRLLDQAQLSHLAHNEPPSTQKAALSPPTSSVRHAEHLVSSAGGARGFWEESEWAAAAER
jgi:hypothetical protein